MSLGRVGTFNSKPFTFRVKDKSIRVCLCFEKYSLMFNGEKMEKGWLLSSVRIILLLHSKLLNFFVCIVYRFTIIYL